MRRYWFVLSLLLVFSFSTSGCFGPVDEILQEIDTDDDNDCIFNLVELALGLNPEDNDSDNDSYLDTYDRFPLDPLQYKLENESFIRSSCLYEGEVELTESGEVVESDNTLDGNAQQTGEDTQNEIGGKVSVISAWISNSENNNSSFNLVWELAAGSVQIWEDDIEWQITCDNNGTYGSVSGDFIDTMDIQGNAGLENLSNLALSGQVYMVNLRSSFDDGTGCPITLDEQMTLMIHVNGGGSTYETLSITSTTEGSSVV